MHEKIQKMAENWIKPVIFTKFDSKKDESKDKAVVPAGGAEEAAKDNSTPTGKRKGGEVISPSGLTPKNKTTNTGMFIFDTQKSSHKFVGYNIRPIMVKLC